MLPSSNDLLVISDMQEWFRYPNVLALVEGILSFQTSFPGNTAYTTFIDTPGSVFENNLHRTKFQAVGMQKLLTEIQPSEWGDIFEHTGYSLLTDEFLEFYDLYDIERVRLCGVYLDVTILYTAFQLREKGIPFCIVEDLVTTQDVSHTPVFLESMKRVFGDLIVVNSTELMGVR